MLYITVLNSVSHKKLISYFFTSMYAKYNFTYKSTIEMLYNSDRTQIK